MSLAAKLLSASGGGVDKLFVDDCFSSFTYTGNGSTQTINNGIDLAGKGGMVWGKFRSGSPTHQKHFLQDSARGVGNYLSTDQTDAQNLGNAVSSFNATGFSLTSAQQLNTSAVPYASWAFRRAPKFFDVVTYTGNGVAGRQIPHALGIAPGMMVIKATSSTSDWFTWHRSLGASQTLALNTTAAASGSGTPGYYNQTDPTSSVFSLGGSGTNLNGVTYVAYLFAHDTSADGIVQCGSFTTDGSCNATVNLGWEPQYVLIKSSSGTAGVSGWVVFDSSRGLPVDANGTWLYPNTSGTEVSNAAYKVKPNATGFGTVQEATTTYIYLAIRRPNKPPTTGTEVYNAIARTGTGAAATVTGVGFAPDLVVIQQRSDPSVSGAVSKSWRWDRLRGAQRELTSSDTGAEGANIGMLTAFSMDGNTLGADLGNTGVNVFGNPSINHFFKRAPGVFDVVCYTGTGVAKTEGHNLGVAPELMIVKRRSAAEDWTCYVAPLGASGAVYLNTSGAYNPFGYWNSTAPSASVFSLSGGGINNINGSGSTYVAYLFATKAGISKVGSYTGNGTSQTIDCGFTTGARFVLIKRTDAAGDWYVWDTVRGLVAGNDPHLSLNTSAAEVTSNDSLDPANAGFIVNQLAATNINVTSATYIYLAFA